jgi:hypothetical protein
LELWSNSNHITVFCRRCSISYLLEENELRKASIVSLKSRWAVLYRREKNQPSLVNS